MADVKKPYHEQVAESLIEKLEQGTAPWQRPWAAGVGSFMPFNPTTGKRYKGINALYLMSQGREDARWLTYKQASAMGAQVRKGEKSTSIQYWKFSEEQIQRDDAGKPVIGADGQPQTINVMLERPRVFFASVFNAEQIDGLPAVERPVRAWDAAERAETILTNSGAKIRHDGGDRAFYRPSSDSIHLPLREAFPTADRYYATALHELGHWTGHPDRLGRDLAHPFGSEQYAKEELRAEIFSMIMGEELDLGHDPEQHAAYVGSWIKVLKDDPMEIFRAASDAEKIKDFVLSLEQQREQTRATNQVLEAGDELIPIRQAARESLPADWDGIVSVGKSADDDESAKYIVFAQRMNGTSRRVAELETDEQAQLIAGELRDIGAQLPPLAPNLLRRLPDDWNGRTWVVDIVIEDSKILPAEMTDQEPEAWALYAETAQRKQHLLDDFETEDQAKQAEKQLIDRISFMRTGTLAVHEQAAQRGTVVAPEKTYIKVDYKEKNEAKALGAAWDKNASSWYVPAGVDLAKFDKWPVHEPVIQARQYLAVPSHEYDQARAAGALWDREAKSCYIGPKGSRESLARWLPENAKAPIQDPAQSPVDELADVLRSHKFELVDRRGVQHPILDGKWHRLVAEGDKGAEQSGAYRAFADGRPAGVIINNRTGVKEKWISQGTTLSAEQRAVMVAEAATKLAERNAQEAATFRASSDALTQFFSMCEAAPASHEYLVAKHMAPGSLRIVPASLEGGETDGRILIGKNVRESMAMSQDPANEGKFVFTAGDLLVPATDTEGRIWSLQSVSPKGDKRFAKNTTKEATFYAVGGEDALERAQILFIGEGVATMNSVSTELGIATVAAFDSGNLPKVAAALHSKYPDKPQVICGDNDLGVEMKMGHNPGREKAQEAAAITGGLAIFPVFAPGEQEANPKLTDFEDLANKSVLGRDGVARQVRGAFITTLQSRGLKVQPGQRLAAVDYETAKTAVVAKVDESATREVRAVKAADVPKRAKARSA